MNNEPQALEKLEELTEELTESDLTYSDAGLIEVGDLKSVDDSMSQLSVKKS